MVEEQVEHEQEQEQPSIWIMQGGDDALGTTRRVGRIGFQRDKADNAKTWSSGIKSA